MDCSESMSCFHIDDKSWQLLKQKRGDTLTNRTWLPHIFSGFIEDELNGIHFKMTCCKLICLKSICSCNSTRKNIFIFRRRYILFNHKHAFSSCIAVFGLIACNSFRSYSKYKIHSIETYSQYILPNVFFFIFTAMHFSITPFPYAYILFRHCALFGFCFFTQRERLISLRSILAFVVKRNWYFMAMLIWPKVAKGEGSGKMAHSIRFSKFMARVSVRYVPLYFFCVIYMNTLSGDLQFFLFFFFVSFW